MGASRVARSFLGGVLCLCAGCWCASSSRERSPLPEPERQAERTPTTDSVAEPSPTDAWEPVQPDPSVDVDRYILILGEFDERTGAGTSIYPLFRPAGACEVRSSGRAEVLAATFDRHGAQLNQAELDVLRGSDGQVLVGYGGCILDDPRAERLLVTRGGLTIADAHPTAHAPQVVIEPLPSGDVLNRAQSDVVRWRIHDEDGGPMFVRVATSSDGVRWRPQRTSHVAGGPLSVESNWLSVDYEPAGHLWLEVEVSDGFRSGFARLGPFGVVDCEMPAGAVISPDACEAARLHR